MADDNGQDGDAVKAMKTGAAIQTAEVKARAIDGSDPDADQEDEHAFLVRHYGPYLARQREERHALMTGQSLSPPERDKGTRIYYEADTPSAPGDNFPALGNADENFAKDRKEHLDKLTPEMKEMLADPGIQQGIKEMGVTYKVFSETIDRFGVAGMASPEGQDEMSAWSILGYKNDERIRDVMTAHGFSREDYDVVEAIKDVMKDKDVEACRSHGRAVTAEDREIEARVIRETKEMLNQHNQADEELGAFPPNALPAGPRKRGR